MFKLRSTAMLAAAIAIPVSAEVLTNTIEPIDLVVTNACTGELVTLSGHMHNLLSVTETGNGLRVTSSSQPIGLAGTGATSGATYHGVGITRSTGFLLPPPPSDFTFVNNFYIIGEGAAPNFKLHVTLHATVNANDELTATVQNVRSSCS